MTFYGNKIANLKAVSAVALSLALAVPAASVVTFTPEPVHAQGFSSKFKKNARKFRNSLKKSTRKIRKSTRNIQRKLKSKDGQKVLQAVGVGLAVYGIAKNSPAAAIIGTTLVAAPKLFREDIARNYGKELNWSGCTRCNKRRVVVSPGRKVTKKQRTEISQRVKEDVKDIQSALKTLGYYTLRVDGDYGPGSRKAVSSFQASLNQRETGYLNAEQRYLLFKGAQEQGYTRIASLNAIQQASAVAVPAALLVAATPAPDANAADTPVATGGAEVVSNPEEPAYSGPVIAEFRLASSQFDRFAEEFLKSGSQSIVKDAKMLPDGQVQLQVVDSVSNKSMTLVGTIDTIQISEHRLSQDWIQVHYDDVGDAEPAVLLNTKDDFNTTQEASNWKRKANQRKQILAELTGVELPGPKVDTRIASLENPPLSDTGSPVDVEQPAAPDGVAENKPKQEAPVTPAVVADVPQQPSSGDEERPALVSTKPTSEPTLKPGDRKAGSDGRIVIASVEEPKEVKPAPAIVGVTQEAPQTAANAITDPSSQDAKQKAPEVTDTAEAETTEPAADLKPGDVKADSNGRISLASEEKPAPTAQASVTDTSENVAGQSEIEASAPSADKDAAEAGEEQPVSLPVVTASLTDAAPDPFAGLGANQGETICRQNLYVSFSFPDGESPINHYNIEPPEGTIMMDNGDSTAYFTGACVQGTYGFSYVYVQEAKKKADWKHFKREGNFQIASNGEQCSIDLNTPDGNASIKCY